jgi:hypothetical protein
MKRLIFILLIPVFCLGLSNNLSNQNVARIGIVSGAAGSSLLTNLNGYWILNQASGSRTDSTANATTLTDNNTVTTNTGHVSTPAAQFTAANSEYLSAVANSAINTGDISFTLTCWVYFDDVSASTSRPLLQKGWDDAYGEYILLIPSGTGKPKFQIANGAATVENLGTSVFTTGTWYFIACGYDATLDELWISTNNGTVETASYSGGNTTTTGTFKIGAGIGQFQDGRVQEVGFWKNRRLSSGDLTLLWNGGAGITHPF